MGVMTLSMLPRSACKPNAEHHWRGLATVEVEATHLPLNQQRIFRDHFVDERRLGELIAPEPDFVPAPIIDHGEDQVWPGLVGPERINDCRQHQEERHTA